MKKIFSLFLTIFMFAACVSFNTSLNVYAANETITEPLDFTNVTTQEAYKDMTNGVQWYGEEDDYVLVLDGATIDLSGNEYDEYISSVKVPNGTTIKIGDNSNINCGNTDNSNQYYNYGIFSDGTVTFKELEGKNGTLTINYGKGVNSECIKVKNFVLDGAKLNLVAKDKDHSCIDASDIKIKSGTLVAESEYENIAASTIVISGGIVKATSEKGNHGIVAGTTLSISGGYVEVSGKDSVAAYAVLSVSGGTVKARGSNYAFVCYDNVSANNPLAIASNMTIEGANETYVSGSTKSLTNKAGFDYATITPATTPVDTLTIKSKPDKYKLDGETPILVKENGETASIEDIVLPEDAHYSIVELVVRTSDEGPFVVAVVRPEEGYSFEDGFTLNGEGCTAYFNIEDDVKKNSTFEGFTDLSYFKELFNLKEATVGDTIVEWDLSEYILPITPDTPDTPIIPATGIKDTNNFIYVSILTLGLYTVVKSLRKEEC